MARTLKSLPLLCLLLFSLLIALEHWHTYSEPLERDIATYAVIGHEMNRGRELYSDLWENKPPAIHWTYELAEKLTGYGPQEVYFLGVSVSVLTLLGLYAVGSLWSVGAGLSAALFWAIAGADMMLQANQPNVEVFMNLFLVWAFYFSLVSREEKDQVLSGCLLGLGCLYKPQLLLIAPLLALAQAWPADKGQKAGDFMRSLIRLSLPGLLMGMSCLAYLLLTHRGPFLYDELVVYNRFNSGDLFSNLAAGLDPKDLFPKSMWFLAPLVIAIGLVLGLGSKTKDLLWTSWLALALGVYLAIALPGHFFPHYYQLWLPVLFIGGGWACAGLGEKIKGNSRYAVLFLCAGVLAFYEMPNYRLSAEQWSIEKYGPYFVDANDLGQELGRVMGPEETFFVLNNNTTFYFAAKKSPPSGMVYADPIFWGPLSRDLQARMWNDLNEKRPELLILVNNFPPDYYKKFLGRYRVWDLGPRYGHYILMVQKGSGLEKRVLEARVKS